MFSEGPSLLHSRGVPSTATQCSAFPPASWLSGTKASAAKSATQNKRGRGLYLGPTRSTSGWIVVLNSLRRRTPSSTHPQFLYGWQNVLEHPQAVYRVVDLEACEVGRAGGVKVVKVQAVAAQVGERAGQLQTHWGNHRKLKTSPLAVRLRMGAYIHTYILDCQHHKFLRLIDTSTCDSSIRVSSIPVP